MHEKRLLERIRDFTRDQDRRGEIDPSVLSASILAHLRRLLNTKQGSVPIAEDYGLADLTDLPGSFAPDNLAEIEDKINRVISRYEPRLANIRITFAKRQEDSLSLRFEISGQVMAEELKLPILFESVVEPSGKISLST